MDDEEPDPGDPSGFVYRSKGWPSKRRRQGSTTPSSSSLSEIGLILHFSLGVRGREATRKVAPDSHSSLIRAMRLCDGALGRKALATTRAVRAHCHGNLTD
jgi:hypothetical protein